MDEVFLIAGAGNPVIADLAASISQKKRQRVAVVSTADVCRRAKIAEVHPFATFSKDTFLSACEGHRLSTLVLFLGKHLTAQEQAVLEAVIEIAREKMVERVSVISTFRVHFGDRKAARAETRVLEQLRPLFAQVVVFRPSHVLSPQSRTCAWLRALWFLYPLVPRRFRSCFVDGDELYEAIDQAVSQRQQRPKAVYTLLGPSRTWREALRLSKDGNPLQRGLAVAATFLSWLFIAQLVVVLLGTCAKRLGWLRHWDFDTLRPTSTQELLTLYNKYNYRHVKIVGYNNGVVHFGQMYPHQTVVSTVACSKVVRLTGRLATFDSGATVRQGIDFLSRLGKEFYVVPNYSYVSLGTAFFIPIHGSASEYSTMGDTIQKVLLYDPAEDRFVAARRTDPAFQGYVYNLERPVLLLRLSIRVKDKSLYYMRTSQLEKATGEQVMNVFRDEQPSNVEVRKARAAATVIDVYKYYTQAAAGDGGALPFPKDSLGRLWDKLEANPVSSVLFHALSRRLIHHVELFFREDEFAVFWNTHASLPLLKIQLRYIKRDGLPHSPFRQHDCVSADLGMLKKHKRTFEMYLKETFRAVQFNPGKHSM